LSPEQLVQLQAVDFEIPDYRSLSNGERGGLGMEALEGYAYGERTRFDSQGRRWEFRREPKDDQFWLTITVSVGGLVLAHGALTLDRVAGKEGEEQLLALVEQLVEDAEVTGKVARAQQKALRETEAEEAREAQAQVAADQKAGTDAA
jgi:hypothetical protein